MKNALYLLLLCLVLQGCWRSYPVVRSSGKMLNIPSPPPHNNEVNIFFPGEPLPERPYLKIKMISVSGDEQVPDNQLLNQLKSEAQSEGLDDVILMDKNFKSELVTETHGPGLFAILFGDSADQEVEEITYLQNTKELTGLGIKYIDNMEYVRDVIKTEQVFTYNPDDGSYELGAFVTFKLTGGIQEKEDKNMLLQFLDEHSLDHLVYEETGSWKYKQIRDLLVRRKLIVHGETYKVCDITLDEASKIRKIEIRFTDDPVKETIELNYDENERLIGRVLQTKRFGYLREERKFNDDGSWKEFHYYNDRGTLLMKRSWICFDLDDVRAIAH